VRTTANYPNAMLNQASIDVTTSQHYPVAARFSC